MEFLVTVTSASTSFVDRHIGARRPSDVDAMLGRGPGGPLPEVEADVESLLAAVERLRG